MKARSAPRFLGLVVLTTILLPVLPVPPAPTAVGLCPVPATAGGAI